MTSALKFQLSKSHKWKTQASDLFFSLEDDSQVREFIKNNRAGIIKQFRHYLYTCFTKKSDFDINGLLDIYPLHIFNSKQVKKIVQHCCERMQVSESGCLSQMKENDMKTLGRVLDVGSGVGMVTDILNSVCDQIIATETSPVMCERLQGKGYNCWNEDIALTRGKRLAEGYQFDMVSMLNVIDRTPRPATLLQAAHSLLSPEGLLLIATPLPFRPFYFTADHKSTAVTDKTKPEKYGKPLETFNLSIDGCWESQAETFVTEILPSMGFKPLAFSRLPYISAGDFFTEYIALDDIVIVAQKI